MLALHHLAVHRLRDLQSSKPGFKRHYTRLRGLAIELVMWALSGPALEVVARMRKCEFRAFAQTREICNGFPRHHLAFSLNIYHLI
jgi:hypothetical protein